MPPPNASQSSPSPVRPRPFRSAVLRGLGVFLPPLITVVFFLWIGGTIQQYVLEPVEGAARNLLALSLSDIRSDPQLTGEIEVIDGVTFRRASDDTYVPHSVYEEIRRADGTENADRMTGKMIYRRFVQLKYLKPQFTIPVFLVVFVLALYLLGKFLAAGMGRFIWDIFERLIHRLPLVRNVYSSAKQVTDFMFSHREFKYTRVVAVEYPRKSTWSLGFVTGESLADIRTAAGEPILAVLVPTSPMPLTGFTVTVLKSETVDLNMTVDQALEYLVSCGVVVPPHQLQTALTASAGDDQVASDAAGVESTSQPEPPVPEPPVPKPPVPKPPVPESSAEGS